MAAKSISGFRPHFWRILKRPSNLSDNKMGLNIVLLFVWLIEVDAKKVSYVQVQLLFLVKDTYPNYANRFPIFWNDPPILQWKKSRQFILRSSITISQKRTCFQTITFLGAPIYDPVFFLWFVMEFWAVKHTEPQCYLYWQNYPDWYLLYPDYIIRNIIIDGLSQPGFLFYLFIGTPQTWWWLRFAGKNGNDLI